MHSVVQCTYCIQHIYVRVDIVSVCLMLKNKEDWTELSEGRQGYNKLYCPETSGDTEEILLKRNF